MVQITELNESQTVRDIPLPQPFPTNSGQFKGRTAEPVPPQRPPLQRRHSCSDLPEHGNQTPIANRSNPQSVKKPRLQRSLSTPTGDHQNIQTDLTDRAACARRKKLENLTEEQLRKEGEKCFDDYQKAFPRYAELFLAHSAAGALKPFSEACLNSEENKVPLMDLLKKANDQLTAEVEVTITIGKRKLTLIPPDTSLTEEEARKYYPMAVKALANWKPADAGSIVDLKAQLAQAKNALDQAQKALDDVVSFLTTKGISNPWEVQLEEIHNKPVTLHASCSDPKSKDNVEVKATPPFASG